MAVKCPKCHFDNLDDTSYCGKCATPLVAPDEPLGSLTRIIDGAGPGLTGGAVIAGKYRILDKLGAGGMGEVYRAEDLTLNRQVAIKVLPAVFAEDLERLARFEREAKILASLNHPNIAAIYGVEQADAKRFLVLELVEGETLSERLQTGRLPLDETLEICGQIAEGLEAAHEKSIIHRDLKPSNIKITPEGKVKILDFGLARAFHDQVSEVDLAKSPTITADMTQPGVVLGTAAYMSPEQAKGKAVDKRTDIWAFGCVLYECLTGTRAFRGETITETLAAIIKGEPDWTVLPAGTHWRVRELLHRCLVKDRGQRLRDIGDVFYDLAPGEEPASGKGIPYKSRTMLAGLVLLAILSLISSFVAYRSLKHRTLPGKTIHTAITLPEGHALYSGPAISQDGSVVAFVSGRPSEAPRLHVRRIEEDFEIRPIPGTEDAAYPFFSPDGRSIAFFAKGQLLRVSLEGGIPTPIAQAPNPLGGGTWGDDDSIVFVPVMNSGLMRVAATGGKPEPLLTPDGRSEYAFVHPMFLPGARELLFTVWGRNFGTERLTLANLERRRVSNIFDGNVAYAASGYILNGTDPHRIKGEVMAAPISSGPEETDREAVRVLSGVYAEVRPGRSWYALSRKGTLVYVPGDVSRCTLALVNQDGRILSTLGEYGRYEYPAVSPDGQRVAFTRDFRIFVRSLQRGEENLLSTEAGAVVEWNDRFPAWTPDGSRIIFASNRSGNWDIYYKDASGTGRLEPVVEKVHNQQYSSVGAHNTLAFVETLPETAADIWIRKPDGKQEAWLATAHQEIMPVFSPDERLIAYASDESQRFEIYVSPLSDPGKRFTLSTDGGICPAWSPKGDRLFFRQGTNVMAVDVESDGRPREKPRKLFDGGWTLGTDGGLPMHATNVSGSGFAVMPDGEHFLMVCADPAAVPTRINIVQNWFGELKRLVPTGKK